MASEVVAKARVAHHVPGRVRLRFERGTDVREVARRIEASVAELPGIRGIEVRSAARSVVVHYRPAEVEPERLLTEGLAGAAIELAEEGARAPTGAPGGTLVGRGIVGALSAANAGLAKATRGTLNLADVFPLTLLGLGLRDVARRGVQPVPWYNLLYWGYAIFAELHRQQESPPVPDAAEILRRRFARGELSRDELREMLAELETLGGQA